MLAAAAQIKTQERAGKCHVEDDHLYTNELMGLASGKGLLAASAHGRRWKDKREQTCPLIKTHSRDNKPTPE